MKPSSYVRKCALFLTLLTTLFLSQGCKPRLLPSSNIPTSPEFKSIVTFLEQYRAALKKRSIEGIMEMVAKDFKDNLDSKDPVNYQDLKERLEKTPPGIDDLYLDISVQNITKLEEDIYEVVFDFNKHIMTEKPVGKNWISVKETNRMLLRKRHKKDYPYEYEILSGINPVLTQILKK
jgi:hypothetical protein